MFVINNLEFDCGSIIKNARIKAGITQKQLAELTGLAEITIRQYESNKREPKLENLKKIAYALDIDLLVLIGAISDKLLKNIKEEPNIEKAYYDIVKSIYGEIDISKADNGEFYYTLGKKPNTIQISELTFNNMIECIDYLVKLYVKTVAENNGSQECFSLLYAIKDMELSELQKVTEFAEFIKSKCKDTPNSDSLNS